MTEFSRNRSRKDGYSTWCLDCYKESRERFVSLDYELGNNITRHDVIMRPLPKRTDDSWEKVCMAMWYWLKDKTLKPAHVDVLMMRAVELLEWPEIAEYCGTHVDTIRYHYREAIRRLRERYAGMVEAS